MMSSSKDDEREVFARASQNERDSSTGARSRDFHQRCAHKTGSGVAWNILTQDIQTVRSDPSKNHPAMSTSRLLNPFVLCSTVWTLLLCLMLTLQSVAALPLQPATGADQPSSNSPLTVMNDDGDRSSSQQLPQQPDSSDREWLAALLQRIPYGRPEGPAFSPSLTRTYSWDGRMADDNNGIRNSKRALGIEIPDMFISHATHGHGDHHPKAPTPHMTMPPKLSIKISMAAMRKLADQLKKNGRCKR
ncbi:hypothetical protein BV898_06580 [Hypsibius exemplaris]|uniref:Uncharacterized protein n=1 Tax=Hypsibius exemplaris TaxID=2072580 RepID=A0A1W0WVW4_HYPEX|nr:hypothetical protein BV898_06580 [Hypsibius exemplaris]